MKWTWCLLLVETSSCRPELWVGKKGRGSHPLFYFFILNHSLPFPTGFCFFRCAAAGRVLHSFSLLLFLSFFFSFTRYTFVYLLLPSGSWVFETIASHKERYRRPCYYSAVVSCTLTSFAYKFVGLWGIWPFLFFCGILTLVAGRS